MELKELDDLKKYCSEADLIEIVQEIDDKVICKWYDSEQIIYLVNELADIDLLSVEYGTREEISYLTMAFLQKETGRRLSR